LNPPSFLSLSEDVLLTRIFPELPLADLENLCSINIKFNNVCKNDYLWQSKVIINHPNLVKQKPINMSWKVVEQLSVVAPQQWKNYYLILTIKPLYSKGDRIGYISFEPTLINSSIDAVVNQVHMAFETNIVFIDEQRNPIIIIKYPSLTLDVRSIN
jgi:hypothetical protein